MVLYVDLKISHLIKIVIVNMKELYNLLYTTYIRELHRLNIGYTINRDELVLMFDIINAIDYIKNGSPKTSEIYKIIQYYE